MNTENLTPIDLLEHERFDGFFDVAVAQLTAGRNPRVRYKRSAFDDLKEKGIIDDEKVRKVQIYLCAQKRSSLSKRERDLLEYLTISAGAKLVAWINQQKAKADILKPCCKVCGKEDEKLYVCERCGGSFCADCQAPYNQFTQIDYDCCRDCYERDREER